MRAIASNLLVATAIFAGLSLDAAAQTLPTTKPPAAVQPAPPPAPPPPLKEREVRTTDEIKRESLKGAASMPLRDLNVVRTKVPQVLLDAMADPYARPPRNYRCAQLAALIQPLEDALGSDIDRVLIEDEDMMERSRETALGAAADFASDAIPFRGWVRKLSGAERHERAVRDAITAGAVRRAYLKGLGEAKGCMPPATPSHEKAGMTLTRKDRFKPQYPTRTSTAGPPPPGVAPPAAARR
jgi:hypothetical protein